MSMYPYILYVLILQGLAKFASPEPMRVWLDVVRMLTECVSTFIKDR